MPIYEYRCLNCNEEFEALIFGGDDKVSCPHCNRDKLERLMSSCGFKSSGSFTPSSGSSDCSSCSSTNCSSCHWRVQARRTWLWFPPREATLYWNLQSWIRMTKAKAQISNECQMTNAKKYVTQVHSSMVHGSRLMVSQKVVTPVKTGVQKLCN